jgi:hypothetical protein
MKCPSCGAENPDGKEFCGDCGAKLPDEVPAAVPEPPAAPPVAPPPAYTPPATAPVAPPAYTAPVAPVAPVPAAPKKKLTGPVIAIVVGVLLLCCISCGIGGLFLFKDNGKTTEDTDPKKTIVVDDKEKDRGKISISKEQGFAEPMDALSDIAQQYYKGADWWYVTIAEEDAKVEYYITPDETTYDKGIIVEKTGDEWFVTDIYTVDMTQVEPPTTEPADETDVTPEEYAAYVVDQLLTALYEGRVDDAYAYTMQPLSDYDLSELSGQFDSWEFLGADEQDDGSVVVLLTMYWSDGTQNNVGAQCQWGDTDMYVSDMASAEE